MTHLKLILSFLFLYVISSSVLSQTHGEVHFFGSNSTPSISACINGPIYIAAYTSSSGYSDNETAQITIDWGDGNVENQTITFISGYFTPSGLEHTYTTSGNYQAIFSFMDNYSNSDVYTMDISVSNNCGVIFTNVKLDTDNDSIGEVLMPLAFVDLTDVNGVVTTVQMNTPDQFGTIGYQIYNVDVAQSPYSVTVNPAWLAANGYLMSSLAPTSYNVSISNTSIYYQIPGLVVVCNPSNTVSQTDVAINYIYGWEYRAGQQTGFLHVDVCNFSCSGSQNADLDITFESLLSVASHNIPGATVTGNVLHANLNVNGCSQYNIYFDVPGATPAGTPLNFSASVQPVGSTDFNTANNVRTFVSEVRNSWDPNDKSVDRPEIISPAVQDELTYVIRFQNMGNDEAYNIVIKDTLSDNVDLSTLTMLEYSHTGYMNIDPATRIMTVSFPNIFLAAASVNEPASHGYVAYKIKENAGLAVGSEIKNTAYIYFDANPPIVTNTTFNVNQNMAVEELVADDIAAYPVPAKDFLVISSKQNQPIQSIKLIDVTGKTILNITNVGATYTMDVQGIASGAYSLSIQSQGVVVNKKIMVQK